MPKSRQSVNVAGQQLSLSNLDKVLYPKTAFTKGQVIEYYTLISRYLLPHLRGRPVTLKRLPDGVQGEFFFEKDAPAFTPDWIQTFPVPRRNVNEPEIRYILIDDLATLVWLANLANLEIHPFLHRIPVPRQNSIGVKAIDCLARSLHTAPHDRDISRARNFDGCSLQRATGLGSRELGFATTVGCA